LAALATDELLDERAALAGLRYTGTVGGTPRAPIHRYSFPPQETDLRGHEELRARGGEKFGTIEDISIEQRWVDVKKRRDTASLHPDGIYSHTVIDTNVLARSLLRLGQHVVANGIEGDGAYLPARDLLLRVPPRVESPLRRPEESAIEATS